MDRATLEALDRDALVAQAETAGVVRARVLTRPELIDEILQREPGRSSEDVRRSRGFLGLARDLLARIVERGLHLPDAADRIRGTAVPPVPRTAPSALPTVTLAEIYATQGHKQKAVETLAQVLAAEPEHGAARALLSKLEVGAVGKDAPVMPPETEETMGSSYMEGASDGAAVEPATMLDAEPLPERYDTDECIAMGVDPTTLYVYWEIRDDTFEHLRTRMPDGRVNLRVLVVSPNWDGPRAAARDIEVSSAVGDWFVRELPEGAVIRASVGWLSGDGVFVSAAHSRGVEPSRQEAAAPQLAQWLARWAPEASYPAGASEPEATKLARALARIEARRAAMEQAALEEGGEQEAFVAARRRRLGGSSEGMLRRPAPTSSWS